MRDTHACALDKDTKSLSPRENIDMGPLKRTLVRKYRRPHPLSDCAAFAAETPMQMGQKKKEKKTMSYPQNIWAALKHFIHTQMVVNVSPKQLTCPDSHQTVRVAGIVLDSQPNIHVFRPNLRCKLNAGCQTSTLRT